MAPNFVVVCFCFVVQLCDCSDNIGVVFIKTHKTASSTVAALLRTNAVLWNQSIFIPPDGFGGHQWELNNMEQRLRIMSQDSKFGKPPFRYWTSHVKYNDYFHNLIPSPKVFITVVRDPVSRLESAYRYYLRIGVIRNNTIEYILENSNDRTEWNPNGMSMELAGIGKTENDYVSSNSLEQLHPFLLKSIQDGLLFCLITERLDESLMLFWYKMNWNIQDLVYHHVNPSRDSQGPYLVEDRYKFTEQQRLLVRMESKYDTMLYNLAQQVLIEELATLPSFKKMDNYCTKDILFENQAIDLCSFLFLPPSNDSSLFFQQTQTEHQIRTRNCRCSLSTLNDVEWVAWANAMNPPSNHSLVLEESLLEQLVAPKSVCSVNGQPILCAIAAESINNFLQKQQNKIFGESFTSTLTKMHTNHDNEMSIDDGCELNEGTDEVCSNTNGVNSLVSDRALLVKRGGCSFETKAKNAQTLGYHGLVIVDWEIETLNKEHVGDCEVPLTPGLSEFTEVDILVWMVTSKAATELILSANQNSLIFEGVIVE